MKNRSKPFPIVATAAIFAVLASGCFGQGGKMLIRQAGSSTVLPIAQAWAEEFEDENDAVTFSVLGGGSGSGLNQFCAGEVHIADSSRKIKDSEKTACASKNIEPFELQVAIDGLAVVVSKQNTFATDLKVDELYKIWTAKTSAQANRWKELRPAWPDEKIVLYGPGTNSGTFDYFNEEIIAPKDGTGTKTRSDYTPSEDDNVLVTGVSASPYALAYFGLAYVSKNAAKIRALPIDDGKGQGPVEPTSANVESGKYTPLARPLFMYTDGKPAGHLKEYFQFGLGAKGQDLVREVGYIALPEAKRSEMLAKIR